MLFKGYVYPWNGFEVLSAAVRTFSTSAMIVVSLHKK